MFSTYETAVVPIDEKIAIVGPATTTNNSSSVASPIFTLLKTFTPPSRPRTTEQIAMDVTPTIIAT